MHAALQPDVSRIAVDIKLFHESGCRLIHKYRIYDDPLPHLALRDGVIKKLLGFVHWAMAIAQLTHLHLTIPSSGSTSEPVPSECCQVVPLSRESTISRWVSFAREDAVIESSPLLFSASHSTGALYSLPSQPMCCFPVRNPWMTRTGSRLLGFHLFLLHLVLFRLSLRAIFRSRLAPLRYLIHHQRFPHGAPPVPPDNAQDVLRLSFVAFSD